VYCAVAGISATADHVFAREFFPIDKRANLPQVPACERCNGDKSRLEHYLLTVLPFGGRHADSAHVLGTMVEGRLASNAKLHRALSSGKATVLEQSNGILLPTMTIPFEGDKLAALAKYIARGLTFHHFGTVIAAECHVEGGLIVPEGEALLMPILKLKGQLIVNALGDGAVEYEGVQSIEDPEVTVWRMRLYGGVALTGDPAHPGATVRAIWMMSSKGSAFGKLLGVADSRATRPLENRKTQD
jgi:hypothetical protein